MGCRAWEVDCDKAREVFWGGIWVWCGDESGLIVGRADGDCSGIRRAGRASPTSFHLLDLLPLELF